MEIRSGQVLRASFLDKELEKRVLDELSQAKEPQKSVAGKSYYGSNHISQIQDFVDAILEKRKPFITGAEARKAVDLVLAIYKSHQTGRCVQLGRDAGR